MTILVDACLSPGWVPYLESGGFPAIHWSSLGPTQAPDAVIFDIARQRGATTFKIEDHVGRPLRPPKLTAEDPLFGGDKPRPTSP